MATTRLTTERENEVNSQEPLNPQGVPTLQPQRTPDPVPVNTRAAFTDDATSTLYRNTHDEALEEEK